MPSRTGRPLGWRPIEARISAPSVAVSLGITAGMLSPLVLLASAVASNLTGMSLVFMATEIAMLPVVANAIRQACGSSRPSGPARQPMATPRAGFRAFPADFFLERLKAVRGEVRIMDTYTALLADQARRATVIAILHEIVRSGGHVQIILLDADSWVADQRSEVLRDHLSAQLYRQRLQDNLRELYLLEKDLESDPRGEFQVRLIDSLPGVTCYQLDNRMLTTFTPLAFRADDAPQSWVTTDSPVGRFVSSAFDDLWKHAIDLQDRLFCRWSTSADCSSLPWRAPYVTLDGNGAQYMAIRDPDTARLVFNQDVIVADLPTEDGTRVPQWYRPRPIHEDPLLIAQIVLALNLKYGILDEDGEVFEVVPAQALA